MTIMNEDPGKAPIIPENDPDATNPHGIPGLPINVGATEPTQDAVPHSGNLPEGMRELPVKESEHPLQETILKTPESPAALGPLGFKQLERDPKKEKDDGEHKKGLFSFMKRHKVAIGVANVAVTAAGLGAIYAAVSGHESAGPNRPEAGNTAPVNPGKTSESAPGQLNPNWPDAIQAPPVQPGNVNLRGSANIPYTPITWNGQEALVPEIIPLDNTPNSLMTTFNSDLANFAALMTLKPGTPEFEAVLDQFAPPAQTTDGPNGSAVRQKITALNEQLHADLNLPLDESYKTEQFVLFDTAEAPLQAQDGDNNVGPVDNNGNHILGMKPDGKLYIRVLGTRGPWQDPNSYSLDAAQEVTTMWFSHTSLVNGQPDTKVADFGFATSGQLAQQPQHLGTKTYGPSDFPTSAVG